MLLIHQKKALSNVKKREELKSIIDRGKLGHKWTHERVDNESNEIINKKYAEYKQRELNKKGEKNCGGVRQACH